MSQSIESPWDRGKLLFTSVAMTTMLLVVVMINPIPMSPFLSSQVASPRLCRQGGSLALFILKPTSWRRAKCLRLRLAQQGRLVPLGTKTSL